MVDLPEGRFIGGSHSQVGVLWKGEQFLELVRKDCLEEVDFHEGCEGEGKRLGREKARSGVRTPDLVPPSQAIASLCLHIPSPSCWLASYPV